MDDIWYLTNIKYNPEESREYLCASRRSQWILVGDLYVYIYIYIYIYDGAVIFE